MEILVQALVDAVPAWEQALRQLNWHHGLILVAYLGAAWLCILNGYIAKGGEEACANWYVAAAVLSLLAVNTVLHGDVLVTHTLRSLAKQEGWYGQRRTLQYGAVTVLVLAALWVASGLRRAFAVSDGSCVAVAAGLSVLLVLLALRTVSAHGTDAMINPHLAGVSVGRWLELAGLGLVLHGAFQCLRLR